MEQIVQQYIQAKGLNEQQAQQLIQELQQLDEQQLQQVIGNMQQQLQGNNQEEQMMQYGGSNKSWINSYGHKMEKTGENGFKIYSKPKYEKIHPPIYVTNSKDPRIGSYTKEGNQILYKKPNFKPKLALKQKENLNTEIFNNEDSFSDFDSVVLPKEEIYIAPEQKKYSSGQQSYELNDNYLQRLHQENTTGIKQTPKLIRNQYGGVPVSMDGLYEFPNQKVVVPNGNITMKGINYPVEAYDADNGEFLQTMQPNQNYQFDVDNVLEVPKGRFGISKMQSGGSKVVSYFSNNFNNDEVRDIMLERRLEREQIAKGEKQALEDLKKLKKSKNSKGKIEKTFGKNETKAFFDELEDFTEEQIDDVIKKGDESKHSGKFKKILRGKGNILLNLFEASPLAQAFIQESSTSPTQVKPTEKQIDSKTAFNLRKQGYNIPDSMIEGNKNTLITPIKSNIQNTPITNYFQPNTQPLLNNFNSNLTDSTSQYSGNTPTNNTNNSVGKPSTKNFGITNNSDKFGFVSQLKGEKTSKQENINDYKTWVKDWSTKIDGFDKLPYANQQMVAMQWVKAQRPDVYDGLKKQWETKGYNKNGKGFEGFLNDGMYANITSSLRPSTLIEKTDNYDKFLGGKGFDTDKNVETPFVPQELVTSTTPILKEDFPIDKENINDEININDVILGKLNNTDYSGRYLSNLKLRNNTIKMPYFGRTDLKNPNLYTQNISPYLNDLYSANNSAKQNLDMNSAVGQSAQIQLGANLLDRVNDVRGKVYNTNMQQTVNWENALADIYNKQQQIDDGNRRQYDDDVNRILANKQNVDNEIDRMGYEFKQTGVRNKNNLLLSQMLHPNYVIQDDGTMVRKGERFNKGYNEYLEEEMKRLKEENDKLKTKVAKYGIKKKLK